jgi:hypothetical protein
MSGIYSSLCYQKSEHSVLENVGETCSVFGWKGVISCEVLVEWLIVVLGLLQICKFFICFFMHI